MSDAKGLCLKTEAGNYQIKIIDFHSEHINQAMEIAVENYITESLYTKELPEIHQLPEKLISEYEAFAASGFGTAAMTGEKLIGFLCVYMPLEDAFATTNVRGTFSPIHAHGVISSISGSARERIYSELYQEAAKKWVNAGIRSHSIALYRHDKEAINSFFYNGFGLRCLDLIRSLKKDIEMEVKDISDRRLEYTELVRKDWGEMLELHNGLREHLGKSPVFMRFPLINEAELYSCTSKDVRYFAAKKGRNYIAYIKLSDNGENFAANSAGMVNICGAYCLPEYRGTGIYQRLLQHMILILRKEGHRLLGVDCESLNPTARGFWLKYFREYTYSMVRRIDDKAVDAAEKTENNYR